MRIEKSRSGRKVYLQDHETPKDFGSKHQRELLESYDLSKGETFFGVLAKMLFYTTIIFVVFIFVRDVL